MGGAARAVAARVGTFASVAVWIGYCCGRCCPLTWRNDSVRDSGRAAVCWDSCRRRPPLSRLGLAVSSAAPPEEVEPPPSPRAEGCDGNGGGADGDATPPFTAAASGAVALAAMVAAVTEMAATKSTIPVRLAAAAVSVMVEMAAEAAVAATAIGSLLAATRGADAAA